MEIQKIYNVVIGFDTNDVENNLRTFLINKQSKHKAKELSINPMYLILDNGLLFNNVRKR